MTYCAAIKLKDGLIFASDTRTNAGLDHISTFRKLYCYGIEGERTLVLQTAGNLATSQAVFTRLQQAIDKDAQNHLLAVTSLFDAANMVGEIAREVAKNSQQRAGKEQGFTSSFLLGGQIAGQTPELYNIYPEGNCIAASEDTPYFQIGESKYGKPIIDRSLNFYSSLDEALRAVLISFDSTIRSNLSVGFPIDLMVYKTDSLVVPRGKRVEEKDAYYSQIREQWSEGLRKILAEIPHLPEDYWL